MLMWKASYLIIKGILAITLIAGVFNPSFAQEKSDTTFFRNAFKLDVIPLYFNFFDTRVQYRAAVEYERYLTNNISLGCYLDAGTYDKYKYIKYYNFFNENEGFYAIEQRVTTHGIHLLPNFNYYLLNPMGNPGRSCYASAMLDFSHYWKQVNYANSLTGKQYSDNYQQSRLGFGLGVGLKEYFAKHLFFEIKTSLFTRIYEHVSQDDRVSIRALDAQWTSHNYQFWWISNLKFGYAF